MAPKLFSDIQLREKNIDALKRYLRPKLGGYRVAIRDITTDNLFYRGVRWNRRPQKISDLSCPPAEMVRTLGRVNRIGQPMFYASRAAPSVLFELRAKQGDLIALSEWELTAPIWMHNLGYHADALVKMGAPSVAMRPWLANPIAGEPAKNVALRRQLSLAFTEDIREGREYRYKQSIAINELLFDGASPLPTYPGGPSSDRVAGTVYPALQMRGAADNVAVWPEFVGTSLRIKSVRFVLVEASDASALSYTTLTTAITRYFRDGEIIWQEELPSEIRRRNRIAMESGLWVLRDGFGQIYDLH